MRAVGAVLLLVCALGGVASADDAAARQQARDHYQKGTTAYDLGHYDAAISEYEAAYALYNEPTILYNLGQAHRLARHTEQALHFYKMYLVKVPNASNHDEVEAKIVALNKAIEEERKARSMPPDRTIKPGETPPATTTTQPEATPPTTTAPTTTTEATPPTTAPVTPPAEPQPSDTHARTFKIAGVAVGVAGLALVAGGIVAGVLAKQNADAISKADANHQPYDPAKYSAYQNDLVASGVLIGVGAAATITGTTLAIIGMRRSKKAMALQIDPQLSPTHAGLSATVHF
jgi:tetratricopeptide (TPR) repeat protein